MTTPAEHAATVRALAARVRADLRKVPVDERDGGLRDFDKIVALAERATELERELAETGECRRLCTPENEAKLARAEQLETALRRAVRTIDRWDATIDQPPDPPTAEEILFGIRDSFRAALDGGTATPEPTE